MDEQNKQSETSRNDAKQHYALLETNKSWRLVKVIYFIITAVLALILLGAYSHDSETWFGFFMTIILIYPGYLLVRKLFMYISGDEGELGIKSAESKQTHGVPAIALDAKYDVRRPSKEQLKLLQHAEHIALALDKAIQSGEISDDDVEKAQTILNKVYKKLEDDEESLGSKAYIMYEAQALISWIEKDRVEARKLLNMALNVKGDDNLFTESATDLIGNEDLFSDSATDLLELPNIENEKETIVKVKNKSMSLSSMFIIFLIFFVGGQIIRYSVSNLFGSYLVVVSYIFFLIWIIKGIIYLIRKNK